MVIQLEQAGHRHSHMEELVTHSWKTGLSAAHYAGQWARVVPFLSKYFNSCSYYKKFKWPHSLPMLLLWILWLLSAGLGAVSVFEAYAKVGQWYGICSCSISKSGDCYRQQIAQLGQICQQLCKSVTADFWASKFTWQKHSIGHLRIMFWGCHLNSMEDVYAFSFHSRDRDWDWNCMVRALVGLSDFCCGDSRAGENSICLSNSGIGLLEAELKKQLYLRTQYICFRVLEA